MQDLLKFMGVMFCAMIVATLLLGFAHGFQQIYTAAVKVNETDLTGGKAIIMTYCPGDESPKVHDPGVVWPIVSH